MYDPNSSGLLDLDRNFGAEFSMLRLIRGFELLANVELGMYYDHVILREFTYIVRSNESYNTYLGGNSPFSNLTNLKRLIV